MGKSYINDVGTRFTVYCCKDLTTLTTGYYEILKPDNTIVNWTFTIQDTISGIVYYTTEENDLDTTGRYKLQTYLRMSNGDHWRSETYSFDVFARFK